MSRRSDYSCGSAEALRSAIDDIADQLAVAVDGRFEFVVKAPLPDVALDKLAMLVNFVVESARRTLIELQERNARLAELDHVKSTLLANVSHELRTPLALILGPTEKWLTAGVVGDEQRRDLEVVMRNARALLKTVNDLLDVSKLEAGRLAPRYARVNLGDIVRGTCSLFEGVARERSVAFSTSAPRELIAEIDPDMIQRVLLNLLSNAFKFGSGGGRITCVVESMDTNAVLRVQDHGPGIPSAMREKVFERFVQVEGEATRRAGGTGLGLAIAKEFVLLHRGTIEATPAPGGGALFVVKLPLKGPPGTEIVDETSARGAAGTPSSLSSASAGVTTIDALQIPSLAAEVAPCSGPERGVVLVVDDDPEMSRFIASVLSDEYRIVNANGGREALAQIARRRPDLVLTDVMMPEMSGDELVREIRKNADLDGIPIVVLTARADDALRVQLLEAGAQDYVMKPFSRVELKARVRNLISSKRAGDLLRKELGNCKGDLEELARKVSLRRHELERSLDETRRARDEVHRLLQLRDEFISVASHELKTPLTPMGIQTQMLMRAMRSGAPGAVNLEKMRTYVEMCSRQIGTLQRLIETLLDLSRIRLGSFSLNIEPGVELVEVTRDVIERHRLQSEAARAPVTLQVDGAPPRGAWDRLRLERVASHLLSNAIRYGGGHPIEIAVSHDAHVARLTVRDYGIGISAEDRVRIFNRFERVGSIKSFGGLGLGLYVTRQIVVAHGGTIGVESQPGAGSTFIVELPLDAT
jgi:signal transduction histidine kinase